MTWMTKFSIIFLIVCGLLVALFFMAFFSQLPIENTSLAIDWKGLWIAVQGGQIHYENALGFRIPPWDALLVLPLGGLSMRASWGLVVFITTAILVASVPRRRRFFISVVLLVLSFPSLRHAADGNFEAFIIAGVVLIVYAFHKQSPYILAAGILLATAKPQEVVLLMVALGLYMLLALPRKVLFQCIGMLALITLPLMLWLGRDWVQTMFAISERGSIMDVSLMSALNRTGFFSSGLTSFIWIALIAANLAMIWITRSELSREKAGMLIAASLLISPYAAGNSVLTVLAIGIIPLFQSRRWLGALLILLIDLTFLTTVQTQAYYTTAVLLLTWGILAWQVLQQRDRVKLPHTTVPSPASVVSG